MNVTVVASPPPPPPPPSSAPDSSSEPQPASPRLATSVSAAAAAKRLDLMFIELPFVAWSYMGHSLLAGPVVQGRRCDRPVGRCPAREELPDPRQEAGGDHRHDQEQADDDLDDLGALVAELERRVQDGDEQH